jgi:hypothetical protein
VTDTTTKTAEALLREAAEYAGKHARWSNEGADLSDRITAFLAAQPQAEPVADMVIYSPIETSPHAEKDGRHPNDNEPYDPDQRQYLVERGDDEGQGLSTYWKWGHSAGWNDHKRHLAARPPVAPPAPAARREPGWNGPMVNDAAAQAEPVAADQWAQSIAKELHKTTVALESDGDPAFAHIIRANRAALATRPPVAPPAPAARREPGWNGPMVNDAAAQAEPVAADGFVLVPVEPTPEMEAAGSDAGDGHDWAGPRAVYGAMLAARPPVVAEEAEDNERFDKAVDDARQWLQHEQAVYLSVPSTRKLVLRIMDALASPPPAAAQPVAQGLTDLGPYFCGYARISNGEYKLAGMRSTEVMKDGELHPIYAFPHELIEALHALSTTHPAQADEGDSRG